MRTRLAIIGLLLSLIYPFAAHTAPALASEYIDLQPAFVGTIGPGGAGSRVQYLKADVALRVREPAAIRRIEYHDPLIRNALVALFARQTSEALATLDGKEALRAAALAEVRSLLEKEEGKPLVDDLLFTNLIVQ